MASPNQWIKAVLFFAAVVVGSVLVGIYLVRFEPVEGGTPVPPTIIRSSSEPRIVPNVVGFVAARARADINRSGFAPRVSHVWSHMKKGLVIRQHPPAEGQAVKGATITYVVSNGLPTVPYWITHRILGVAPTPLKTAKQKLNAQDLTVRSVVFEVNTRFWHDNGEVFASEPASGATLRPGTSVILYVTKPAACTPGYSACLPPQFTVGSLADYDCAGTTGDGPYYSPYTRVWGSDPYRLDGDGDGAAC